MWVILQKENYENQSSHKRFFSFKYKLEAIS